MPVQIDLNRIEIFKEVVQAGSFSKAASLLKQPKSRISRNISALEREVGVQLIQRTTRQFQLTDAGRELFRNASQPLNDLRSALEQVSAFSEEVSGNLRISAPQDVGMELLGQVSRDFMRAYPRVNVEVLLNNEVVDLVKDSVDIAIRIGRLKDSSMLQKKLGSIRVIPVISSELASRVNSIKSIEDLEKIPFLAFSSSRRTGGIKLTKGDDSKSISPKSIFSCNNHFILKDLALQGVGFSFIPYFLIHEEIQKGQLIHLFKDWYTEELPIQFVMLQHKEIAPRIKRFVEFASETLKKRFS